MDLSFYSSGFDQIEIDNCKVQQFFKLYKVNKNLKFVSLKKLITNELLKFIINQPNVYYYKKDINDFDIIIDNKIINDKTIKLKDFNKDNFNIIPNQTKSLLTSYKFYNEKKDIFYLLLNNNLTVFNAIKLLKSKGISEKILFDKDNKKLPNDFLLKDLPNKILKCGKIIQKDNKKPKTDETHYIYMLQEREFIKSNENIYKIGYTSRSVIERFNEYPKYSNLLFCCPISCSHSRVCENNIIKICSSKFIQRKDIGIEYFEGLKMNIIKEIINIIKEFIS